jgi:hypothetical protein
VEAELHHAHGRCVARKLNKTERFLSINQYVWKKPRINSGVIK